MRSTVQARVSITTMLALIGVLSVFALSCPMAGATPILPQYPALFNGRQVLPVVGDSAPHGAYGSGGTSSDVASLIQIILRLGQESTASIQDSRLDTEVMDYPSLNWRTGYSTQDAVSVGDPMRSIVNYKYNSRIAGAWLDVASGRILTASGGSYSSPDGNHALIALLSDGGRNILLVSAMTGFSVRAAGAILSSYASYPQVFNGVAVVFIPHDDDADGFFEPGESVTVLENVQAGVTTTTSTPTTSTTRLSIGTVAMRIIQGGADVHYIFPSPSSQGKAPGVIAASFSDWVAAAYLQGYSAGGGYLQNLDTDASVDRSNGKPSLDGYPSGSLLVLVSGPIVHGSIKYYFDAGSGLDRSPVYFRVTTLSGATHLQFVLRSTGVVIGDAAASDISSFQRDQAVVQSFADANGRLVFIITGFTYQGTVAGAKWFVRNVMPNPSAYTGSIVVVQWNDAPTAWLNGQSPGNDNLLVDDDEVIIIYSG